MLAMLASTSVSGVPDRSPPARPGQPVPGRADASDGPPRDPRSVLTRPAAGPDLVLRWADHDDGLADVWLPPVPLTAPAPAPLLYAIHGGFWRQPHGRRELRPFAHALSTRGWVVVVPEYARSGGRHLAAGLEAPWPLLVEDLRAVRARVPELLEQVAPGRVDASRPVVVGHSAGGHLALWWALDSAADAPQRVARHVLSLAPVADVGRADAEGLGEGAVDALLGGSPGRADRLAEADTAARLRAGERVPGCGLALLHGTEDLQVPVAHSADLAADVPTLQAKILPGVEHFALIDPLSTVWAIVLAALPNPSAGADPPAA